MKTKKILFYVHFNKKDEVDDYVIYQLGEMRKLFDKVILISNSHTDAADKPKFNGLYDQFIQRENVGYDFAAWRDGFNEFGWDRLTKYDELTIMNDTCFGPIHDFEPIYREMQSRKVDFWGMTSNLALNNVVKDENDKYIYSPIHLQSYYITFNKNVTNSIIFKNFWTSVKNLRDVMSVIRNYEIVITDLLAKNGFTYDAYYDAIKDWGSKVASLADLDTSAIGSGDMNKYNPGYTCTRPLWLLNAAKNYPFIKTKSVYMAADQMGGIREYIRMKSSYPVRLLDLYIGSRYDELIKAKEEQIQKIQNSRSYKFGRAVAGIYNRVMIRR